MSAQPFPQRRSWIASLVAQLEAFAFETVEVEPQAPPAPVELRPHPVVAVVSAASGSGASTVARLLAAELAVRAQGAAIVVAGSAARRAAPPSRAAVRLATALTGAAQATALGRLCIATVAHADADGSAEGGAPNCATPDPRLALDVAFARLVEAARYLAPVVFDVPPDGSAASIARIADSVVVVAGRDCEPALLDAVAGIVGGDARTVANRAATEETWRGRADFLLPESRLAARAAALGACALGPLASAISELADSVGDRSAHPASSAGDQP